jgi:GTP cyclohydrolase I
MKENIKTLIKEIEERIEAVDNDKGMDKWEKAIIIRENIKILVRCQHILLLELAKNL